MHQALERVLKEEGALKRNRNGVIPVHPEFRSTKSLSPVLWSLINEVPPNHLQKPHRHTSVALDLAVEGAAVSTLVGDALEKDGALQNAEAVRWEPGMAFTTPSWLWHAHKNDGDTPGLIFPFRMRALLHGSACTRSSSPRNASALPALTALSGRYFKGARPSCRKPYKEDYRMLSHP